MLYILHVYILLYIRLLNDVMGILLEYSIFNIYIIYTILN